MGKRPSGYHGPSRRVFGTNARGGLSGGQAQRVQISDLSLARRDHPSNNTHHHPRADVLILDEGTSALDGEKC
jgi:energy-coupling factor transporter ATP-binding protein EcfA2